MPTAWQQHDRGRVLIVGTTDDYIDWIRCARPGQAIFLTAPGVRGNSIFETPRSKEEVLADLDDEACARDAVAAHLVRFRLTLSGIACFDCEHLGLAAFLASAFGLPYHSRKAIENARDKAMSKEIWMAAGINCPRNAGVNSVADVLDFMAAVRGAVVLKPVSGSGSELVFKCRTPDDCTDAFSTIRDGLDGRASNPLFRKNRKELMLAEEMIEGPEFSADFMVEQDEVKIIRICRKIKFQPHPFGTIAGYQLLADPAASLDMTDLRTTLFRGATSLGITRGICMADFIRNTRKENVLVEITPRPGGDCIPQLIRQGMGVDMLSLTLETAKGVDPELNGDKPVTPLIAVRIFAPRAGTLKKVDTGNLTEDPRVKSVEIKRSAGYVIVMPPEDYDSWILGHYIIAPDGRGFPETQSWLMSCRIQTEIC